MFPELTGEIGSRMMFHGREVVVWSINNYLGLANHPEVRKTDAEAAAKWGLAYPMGARLMTGETSLHKELERKLAAHVYKEAAAVVNYGYPGVVSAIDALIDADEMLLCMMQKVMVVSSMAHVFISVSAFLTSTMTLKASNRTSSARKNGRMRKAVVYSWSQKVYSVCAVTRAS